MSFFEFITSNKVLNIAFIAWASAQIIKTLLVLITTKKFDAERLFGAGGMPSSHTALVVSLTTAVLRVHGFSSTYFTIALVLSAVVMYDAMGVRREAGEHAKLLNSIAKNIFTKDFNSQESVKALKEYLG
ncbi:MAG: divergent PAP2 family protein, partial [Oscillospiraceae bacterium]